MPLRLVMLTPYRMPGHHALMLGEADTLAWQNAWRLTWHPGLLRLSDHLPTIADAGDHASPIAGTLYFVPESPTPYLPAKWNELVQQAGAAAVRTSRDWSESLERLRDALPAVKLDPGCLSVPDDVCNACYALGIGYIVVDTLFEAMDHTRTLDAVAFTAEVKAAANGDLKNAKAAAERLHAARETVYPAPIYLLNIAILGEGKLPARSDIPLNLIASAAALGAMPADELAGIRQRSDNGTLELCGGIDYNRPEVPLPIESQLWQLHRGQEQLKKIIGKPTTVFARADTAFHPYLPNWLAQADIAKCICVAFDGGTIPRHTGASIRWPAPDGRHIDALTRSTLPASDPQTGFHLAMHLHQTIMQDSSATLVLRHGTPNAACWFDDWVNLSQLAPVLGSWTIVSRFLDEASVGEYASAASMDDYSPDISTTDKDPVSAFARHARSRRRIDAARTYQALLQCLGTRASAKMLAQLDAVEDEIERSFGCEPGKLTKLEGESASQLSQRLVARTTNGQTGTLVLNPCPFTRRVGLELSGITGLPATVDPVKAVQRDGDITRLVVEVPGLGYAWIPDADAEAEPARMTLAAGTTVRNEFFEAEIDPETGGLRTFRDAHGRANILGQQLIWQPGSVMRAESVCVTACGPAVGEVTAHGELVDEHGQRLAKFTQRFRAWLGRPLLELQIELHPAQLVKGQPWHAYYGARFAARDDQVSIVRGVFGRASTTTHNRPGSPDYLSFHSGKNSALVLTGGLPFAQRHAQRMVDVILITANETCSRFDLSLGLNRTQPAQSAQGFVSPVTVVHLDRGPPPAGPNGWLAHLDTAHVLLTSIRPVEDKDAIDARLFEVAGVGGPINLRFARDPRSAAQVDPHGLPIMDALVDDDNVSTDVMAHDLINLRVDWS